MKALILCGLLGLASCLGAQEQKTPSYRVDVSVKGKLESGQMVSIFSCGTREYASIYSDPYLMTPLANPLLPDAEGRIGFFIPLNESVEGVARNVGQRGEKNNQIFPCFQARMDTIITGDLDNSNVTHVNIPADNVKTDDWKTASTSSVNSVPLTKSTVRNVKTEPGVTATVLTNGDIDVAPSLKCENYQHIDHWPGPCGPSACELGVACTAICTPPPPDECVDDIHFVTEKEWQLLIIEQRDILNAVKLLGDLNHINREEIDQIINIMKKP